MNLIDYKRNALHTEAPLPTSLDRLRHAALGLITETGEYATEVKRVEIYSKEIDDKRRAHMLEELGDAMWYVAIASDALGCEIGALPDADYILVHATSQAGHTMWLAYIAGTVCHTVLMKEEGMQGFDILTALSAYVAHVRHLSTVLGSSLEQVCADNIAKLQLRFPDAFSAEAAEARADKGGLDARNS